MNKTSQLHKIKKLQLEMGYACNLKCTMCFQNDFDLCKKLDKKIWQEKLLPVYKQLKTITIQGGEPTVIPECKDLIELVQKVNPNISIELITNGLSFDQEWHKYFAVGKHIVNFSLNASEKNTYEKICVNSNFDQVMHNLKSLIEFRNNQNNNLKIYISFVILPENINQLYDFCKLGYQLNVDFLRFCFDQSCLNIDQKIARGQVTKSLNLLKENNDPESYNLLLLFWKFYCQHKNLKNEFNPMQVDRPQFCPGPFNYLYVSPYGLVQTCLMSNLIIGNLEKQSLIQVLNNRTRKYLQTQRKKGLYKYCNPSCIYNQNPYYKKGIIEIHSHLNRLFYYFQQSPRAAVSKIVRRIKTRFKI